MKADTKHDRVNFWHSYGFVREPFAYLLKNTGNAPKHEVYRSAVDRLADVA